MTTKKSGVPLALGLLRQSPMYVQEQQSPPSHQLGVGERCKLQRLYHGQQRVSSHFRYSQCPLYIVHFAVQNSSRCLKNVTRDYSRMF